MICAGRPVDDRTKTEEAQLREAHRRIFPQTAEIAARLEKVKAEHEALKKRIVKTPVMRDLPAARQRQTFVHVRGNFLERGDQVEPGFPAAFDLPLADRHQNRLDVAQWLMSPENPLTARVMVNRIWARLFGRGIVETEEDFGLQGSRPSHPELLDHLAIEFRDSHSWSLKSLIRSIVLSATYRQDATVTDAHRERDPTNRWLSRGARFRLPAEVVRDQSLAAAGLLSAKIGGPSVMPPQPDGIWKATYSSLKLSLIHI